MRLISFDIGIKNLAYCVFSLQPTLQKWSIPEWNCKNLIATTTEQITPYLCCHQIKGKRKNDSTHPCNKQSKWKLPLGEDSYCEMHAKMHTEWIIPKKQHGISQINKLKLNELETLYANIFKESTKMKKNEFAERINAYYEKTCFRSTINTVKSKNAGEIDLVTIGRAIKCELDKDPAIQDITHVIIENQISTIASRMKTIQGMIAQYFIMRFGNSVQIEFVSSHNKLKGFTLSREEGEQSTKYKANKSDGINICRDFFKQNKEMDEWLDRFEKSKKRDDLADCFLQGIWYLKTNKIIYYAEDLKINIVLIS